MTRRLPGWGALAVGSGLLGLIASLWILPVPVQTTAVAVFVLCGPGAAVLNWVTVPPATGAILAPSIGLAIVVLLSALTAAVAVWQPRGLLVLLAVTVTLAGLTRWVPADRGTGRARPSPRHSRAGQATGERS